MKYTLLLITCTLLAFSFCTTFGCAAASLRVGKYERQGTTNDAITLLGANGEEDSYVVGSDYPRVMLRVVEPEGSGYHIVEGVPYGITWKQSGSSLTIINGGGKGSSHNLWTHKAKIFSPDAFELNGHTYIHVKD